LRDLERSGEFLLMKKRVNRVHQDPTGTDYGLAAQKKSGTAGKKGSEAERQKKKIRRLKRGKPASYYGS